MPKKKVNRFTYYKQLISYYLSKLMIYSPFK